jgi:hypothetical protein
VTSGNHASPPVLFDTGCDRYDLSTVKDEVIPNIISLLLCIFCKFFISNYLFLIKTDYLYILTSHYGKQFVLPNVTGGTTYDITLGDG